MELINDLSCRSNIYAESVFSGVASVSPFPRQHWFFLICVTADQRGHRQLRRHYDQILEGRQTRLVLDYNILKNDRFLNLYLTLMFKIIHDLLPVDGSAGGTRRLLGAAIQKDSLWSIWFLTLSSEEVDFHTNKRYRDLGSLAVFNVPLCRI